MSSRKRHLSGEEVDESPDGSEAVLNGSLRSKRACRSDYAPQNVSVETRLDLLEQKQLELLNGQTQLQKQCSSILKNQAQILQLLHAAPMQLNRPNSFDDGEEHDEIYDEEEISADEQYHSKLDFIKSNASSLNDEHQPDFQFQRLNSTVIGEEKEFQSKKPDSSLITELTDTRSSKAVKDGQPAFEIDLLKLPAPNRKQYISNIYMALIKDAEELLPYDQLPKEKCNLLKDTFFKKFPIGKQDDSEAVWELCVREINSCAAAMTQHVRRGQRLVWSNKRGCIVPENELAADQAKNTPSVSKSAAPGESPKITSHMLVNFDSLNKCEQVPETGSVENGWLADLQKCLQGAAVCPIGPVSPDEPEEPEEDPTPTVDQKTQIAIVNRFLLKELKRRSKSPSLLDFDYLRDFNTGANALVKDELVERIKAEGKKENVRLHQSVIKKVIRNKFHNARKRLLLEANPVEMQVQNQRKRRSQRAKRRIDARARALDAAIAVQEELVARGLDPSASSEPKHIDACRFGTVEDLRVLKSVLDLHQCHSSDESDSEMGSSTIASQLHVRTLVWESDWLRDGKAFCDTYGDLYLNSMNRKIARVPRQRLEGICSERTAPPNSLPKRALRMQ